MGKRSYTGHGLNMYMYIWASSLSYLDYIFDADFSNNLLNLTFTEVIKKNKNNFNLE